MENGEPPSSSRTKSLFRVGKNSRGNWVVQDHTGLCGGMFVNRAEAVKFAMFENGNRPQAVIIVPGILELDMSRKPRAAGAFTSATQIPVARAARVASRSVGRESHVDITGAVMIPSRLTADGDRLRR